MRITEKQLQILQFLARYTYLTVPHLITLGIATRPQHVTGRHLKPLIEGRYPLVEFEDFSTIEKGRYVRKPRIYTLSKRGRDVLAEYYQIDPATIYYPKGKIQFVRDYPHRTRTIDLLISFDRFASSSVEGLEENHIDTYYRYTGSQRKKGSQMSSVAAIPYSGGIFVPDANLIHHHEQETFLYTLELERQPKTKRIIEEKVFPHAQIIAEGALSKKYDYELSHRVIFVFENQTVLNGVKSFIESRREFSEIKRHFIFGMYEDVKNDFSSLF